MVVWHKGGTNAVAAQFLAPIVNGRYCYVTVYTATNVRMDGHYILWEFYKIKLF